MNIQEIEKRSKNYLQIELNRIIQGTCEFRSLFIAYAIILLICVIIFIVSQYGTTISDLLSASRTTPWGIFTSIFTHSDPSHLAFNMGSLILFLLLFAFCNSTFDLEKKRRMVQFLLVSALIFAVISNILWIALETKGAIGASGFVYAVEGILLGFALFSSLQLCNLSKLREQRISTKIVLFLNIIISFVIVLQVLLSTDIFLAVGQGINSFVHGVSFLLGMFGSAIWCYFEKLSILE